MGNPPVMSFVASLPHGLCPRHRIQAWQATTQLAWGSLEDGATAAAARQNGIQLERGQALRATGYQTERAELGDAQEVAASSTFRAPGVLDPARLTTILQ